MFIGIISDTHGVFSQEFKDFLSPTDQIWHAGDFGGSINFVDEIAAFKPLVGVYGNCDGQDVRLTYPEYQCFECEGKRVLMMHIGGSIDDMSDQISQQCGAGSCQSSQNTLGVECRTLA